MKIECVCGQVESADYSGELGERMARLSMCFSCAFWSLQIVRDRANPQRAVVVDGRHYWIGDEPSGERLKRDWLGLGFGGSEWRIWFLDDRFVISHNLWTQGDIPERWRPFLPDNAEFARA